MNKKRVSAKSKKPKHCKACGGKKSFDGGEVKCLSCK